MAYRKSPPTYEDSRILYFQGVQEDPLFVKSLMKSAGLRPVMKRIGNKNYFVCETDSTNSVVEANRLYVVISWKWERPEYIEDNLKGVHDFRDEPPEGTDDMLLERVPLFWQGIDLEENVNRDLRFINDYFRREIGKFRRLKGR